MVQFCRKYMGLLGDQHDDTQLHPLSGGNCKDKDFDRILGCTFPFMDTAPLDDGSETQVMNFEDEAQVLFEDGLETQVMNFEREAQVLFEDGLETHVMTFIDETQLLYDFDGFENMDTQLLDEWNNDETDKTDGEQLEKTDMLCETDVKSENDSVKLVVCSPDRENSIIFKEDANKEELEALFYKQMSAGVKLDFTSIRVAAIRASGLAARSKVLNRNISELCSLKSENESPKENLTPKNSSATGIRAPLFHAVEVDEGALEEEQVKEKEEESKGRIGNSAVRLFSMVDVELVENEGLNSNYQGEVKDVELSLSNELVGLNFVNKFVNASDRDFSEAFDIIGSTTVSSLKGIQNLARKSGLKSISDENGIYDWDDNREDEGGGEFFSRQKKVFFDDEGKGSPSKLNSSHRAAKKAKVTEVKKNLSKELHLELNVDPLDGRRATCIGKDLQDMLNVGPDTQMAAEAMEVLSLGLNLTTRESKGMSGNTKHTRKCSSIGGKEDKKVCKKYFLRKRSGSSSSGNLTRKSKQQKTSGTNLNREMTVASSKQSKSTKKQHNDFDTSNFVLPSGQEKVRTDAPIASRTRHRSLTQQSVGGNILFDTITGISYGKRKNHEELSDNGHRPSIKFAGQQRNEKPCELSNRSKSNPQSFPLDQGIKRLTRSSLRVVTAFSSSDKECERNFCNQSGGRKDSEEDILKLKLTDREHSPGERSKLSVFTAITPASCTSSGGAASPICMGAEYFKQSCSKNLSKSFAMKEIANKVSHRSEPTYAIKESKRRRDMADVRVMLSRHLDDDIIKHQKKILAKLGASVAPAIREATHFVTDKFVRTRNMLEAIAFGKPVVTHLWLESCGQASCCVDEKNYILRDAKKEKEFGFSLPASLEHACQHPLLQGLKVWITPNTKPGVEVLSSLVKAVHGLPMERIGRSVLKDDKVPDDLIVLSCKEDYAACLPIIEKGVVFSSELLLNGIVTQKLEYERYRLFDDHVKKTRSTLWLKQDSSQYLRVVNCK